MNTPQKSALYKVLIVHNYYQIPGGEDTVAENEKKLLEEHGHQVICYTRSNCELNNMSRLKKLLLPFTGIFSLKTYREVRKIIKENNIDIVHVHNTLTLVSPSVYWAALRSRVPVAQTMHNYRLLCPGGAFYGEGHICEDCAFKGLWYALKRKCYRRSFEQTLMSILILQFHRLLGTYKRLNYICLTEFNKEKLLMLNMKRKELIKPEKVFIKPNFTSGTAILEEGRKEYFIFIGRLEQIKGIDILIEAFSKLPDEKLLLVGTGTQEQKYRAMAAEHKNITFSGYLSREEVNSALRKAKAIIVPSQWYETFGMIIIEAFSNSVPAVVGDIGNIGGLVEDNYTGLHFRYDSGEALIKAIQSLDEGKCREYGKNAYKVYKEYFSPEENYKQLIKIYNKIINFAVPGTRDL